MRKYIVIAGNIGAGKSTLVDLLCRQLGWNPYYEPVSQNPYLEDFYKDMKAWAFHSQIFFLKHRAESHRTLSLDIRSVIQDRSLYEDAEIFARNLFLQGEMSSRDYDVYQDLYRIISDLLPQPDLIIYLKASVPVLKERIRKRGRSMEEGISSEYLEQLNWLYEEWIAAYPSEKILYVETDSMNFIQRPDDLNVILQQLKCRLKEGQEMLFDNI